MAIRIMKVRTWESRAVETPGKLGRVFTNKEMAKELGIDISSLKVEK